MMITQPQYRKLSRIQVSVISWKSSEISRTAISAIRPARICTARVPLISKSSQ